MGALIMSLLFLTNILEPFQALDDAGRPLPHAVLTFWYSQTSEPAKVYADQELTVELSDAKGRVTADSQGRFPFIYLDPDVLYRVLLRTAQGVLRWDVDPYLCDCKDPPRLFRSPVHQALAPVAGFLPSFAAPPNPGARLFFTDPESAEPLRVWADAARTVPLPNPVVSNAAGIFPPIYLDDGVSYRVRLVTREGAELLDVDPYECHCGFLLLTSRPYALEVTDASEASLTHVQESPATVFAEATQGASAALSGTLRLTLVSYEDWPAEATETSFGGAMSGELKTALISYADWPAEATEGALVKAVSGELVDTALVTYSDWPAEATETALVRAVSGTLS